MTDVISAIKALDANAQVVVNGEPSNQTEYEANVKYISGADENGSAVFKDTQDFTWEQVSTKKLSYKLPMTITSIREIELPSTLVLLTNLIKYTMMELINGKKK